MRVVQVTWAVIVTFGLIFIATHGPSDYKPGPTVKVILSQGHGSGVHIGNGYILTAAHVVGNVADVTLKLDDQSEQPAEVLWVNNRYDVALLKTKPSMRNAELSCRNPVINEPVQAEGNPVVLEFIRTSGRIAGVEQIMGRWKSAIPVDLTIVQGMSGGPVFDRDNRVVGINIGVMTINLPMPNLTGIGVTVPGLAICNLLARS